MGLQWHEQSIALAGLDQSKLDMGKFGEFKAIATENNFKR